MEWMPIITAVCGLLGGAFGKELLAFLLGWKKTDQTGANTLYKQYHVHYAEMSARIATLEQDLRKSYEGRTEDLRNASANQMKSSLQEGSQGVLIAVLQKDLETERKKTQDLETRIVQLLTRTGQQP